MTLTATETQKLIETINTGSYSFQLAEIDDYTDEVLIAFAVNNKSIIDKLPKSRMTDPVLFAVAENEDFWEIMRFVNEEDTNQYRGLCIRAVAKNSRNLQFVNERHVDKDFLGNVLSLDGSYSIDSFYRFHPDVTNEYLGKDGLQKLMENDLTLRHRLLHNFLHGNLNNAPITDIFIKDSLIQCPSLILYLKKSSRHHLAVEVISEGGWPEQYANDKPSDLKDAVKRMIKPTSINAQAWQKAYAMTFGIADVVKEMTAPSKIKLLETIYSREEIMPHLSTRSGLKTKGKWLEDALGM